MGETFPVNGDLEFDLISSDSVLLPLAPKSLEAAQSHSLPQVLGLRGSCSRVELPSRLGHCPRLRERLPESFLKIHRSPPFQKASLDHVRLFQDSDLYPVFLFVVFMQNTKDLVLWEHLKF